MTDDKEVTIPDDDEGFELITLQYAKCDADWNVIAKIEASHLLDGEITTDDLKCLLKIFNQVYHGYEHWRLFLVLGDLIMSRDPGFKSEFEASDEFKMAAERGNTLESEIGSKNMRQRLRMTRNDQILSKAIR